MFLSLSPVSSAPSKFSFDFYFGDGVALQLFVSDFRMDNANLHWKACFWWSISCNWYIYQTTWKTQNCVWYSYISFTFFITQNLNISQDLHCCFASSIYSLSNYQLDQCIWFPHLITDFFRVVCRSRWQKEKDKSKGLQIYGCWCFVALSMYNTDEVSFLILLEFWYQIIEWLGTDLFHSILSIRALAETSMNTAYQNKWPPYLSTKNIILNKYDGRYTICSFSDLFSKYHTAEIYWWIEPWTYFKKFMNPNGNQSLKRQEYDESLHLFCQTIRFCKLCQI